VIHFLLIWGVGAIATEIGVTKRQAFYLIHKRAIPVRKVGLRKYVASRAALRAYLAGTTAAIPSPSSSEAR
jgi:hypothetical protein